MHLLVVHFYYRRLLSTLVWHATIFENISYVKQKQNKTTKTKYTITFEKNQTLTHTQTCECQASLFVVFVVGVRQLTSGNLNSQKHVETLTLQQ